MMKEKDFNQSLKNAIDDFEINSEVTFNQERVWKNIKVKKRFIWFDILKVAAVILLFISIGFWYNTPTPIQKEKKQAKKNAITPKLNQTENIEVVEPVVKTYPSTDIYTKNESKLENQVEILESESKIIKTETLKPKVVLNLIIEDKLLIKEPLKTTPEIVYAVQFKRGKPLDKIEAQQKEDALVISFKKYKKPLLKLDTNSIMANSNTPNNIFKLKF